MAYALGSTLYREKTGIGAFMGMGMMDTAFSTENIIGKRL